MDEVDALIARFGWRTVLDAVRPLVSESRPSKLEAVLQARLSSLTVVLENLYDPHNGAAALRSIEAFGLCEAHTVDGPAGTFRASSEVTIGSHKWLDLRSHRDPASCALALRAAGFRLFATIPGAELTVESVPVDAPLALWFGNERDGLSAAARELCDAEVSIPMFGMSQSFNLSVSVALFVYRLAERRRGQLGSPGDLTDERKDHLRARWHALGIRGLTGIVERFVSR